ncbi:MAG: cysteine synthase family protein [Candidatus Competibacter sp.]
MEQENGYTGKIPIFHGLIYDHPNMSSHITELVGNTPLLDLPVTSKNRWRLKLKMEKFNPGGSMKDRMARNMILQAEKDGKLVAGGTIIESSSGNTAIGLAMTAAERGYRFIAVVDHHASKGKIALIQAYGAEVRFIDSSRYAEDEVAVREREILAEKLSRDIPNAVFMQQADNSANAEAYYQTLGNELIEQTRGDITALIGSVGTGGSLCGTARRLKEYNHRIEVIGVEPKGSVIFGPPAHAYYQSGTGSPGNVSIGKNVRYDLIDKGEKVGDAEAFLMARALARKRGILIGGAAGGVLYIALKHLAQKTGEGVMVAIMAEGGEQCLATVHDDTWMQEKGFLNQDTQEEIDILLTKPESV